MCPAFHLGYATKENTGLPLNGPRHAWRNYSLTSRIVKKTASNRLAWAELQRMKAKYFANLPWEENPTSAQKQSGEPLIDSTTQGGTDWICKALPDLERLPRLHQDKARLPKNETRLMRYAKPSRTSSGSSAMSDGHGHAASALREFIAASRTEAAAEPQRP
jgi:hypothetical protein